MKPHVRSLVWSLALLALFFGPLRSVGQWTRPAEPPLDCDRARPDDLASLERCIELRPGDLDLMSALGAAHETGAQWDLAAAVYQRALAIDPDDGDTRVRLAQVLLKTGDADGARREGTAALAVQPGRAAAIDVVRLANAAAANR